jgi:hypothetical protein
MDNTPAYAMALFLHLKFRFNYFKWRWTTKTLKPYLKPTLLAIRKLYNIEYQNNVMKIALQGLSAKKQEKEDIFTAFLNQDI